MDEIRTLRHHCVMARLVLLEHEKGHEVASAPVTSGQIFGMRGLRERPQNADNSKEAALYSWQW